MIKTINNIKENSLMKKIIFNNLSEETKAHIKKEIYNLIKADIKEKQKSIDRIKKRIIYRNIIILVNYTIQFLSVICRFLVKPEIIFFLSEFLSMYPVKLEVNLQLSKVQIGIFRDNIINKQWRNKKWILRTGQVESLIIKNKKSKFKNNDESKDIIINIHYTDLYSFIIKKSNLWFLNRFIIKDICRIITDNIID